MRAPHPSVIANLLTQTAQQLRDQGEQARRMATVLAARGYPTATLGNGSRSSDTTTSTERAALDPNPWANVDDDLTRLERHLWHTALTYQTVATRILAHASDDDPIPAGTGSCARCTKFCRPDDTRPENRIKAGLCPRCYQTWVRQGRPDRSTFLRTVDEEDVA